MYKTEYKSVSRIYTFQNALHTQIKSTKTDLLLYMIDTYDIILSILSHQIEKPSLEDLKALRRKLTDFLITNYTALHHPIPGILLGWTPSMLVWVVLLNVIYIQYNFYDAPTTCVSKSLQVWVKKHRLRMYRDVDLRTWNLDTVLSLMDCLCLRWHTLESCTELHELLEILWRFAARFTLRLHSPSVLNVPSFIEAVPGQSLYRLNSQGVMCFYSRFYWFENMIRLHQRWKKISLLSTPSINETNWHMWIVYERRHFISMKFRDTISDWMWDKLALFGDKEIASHDQLGEDVSTFTCMYGRFPTGLLTKWQRTLTYDQYDDIVKCDALKDFVHLHMINAHFTSNYNISFLKYFFVFEKNIRKHLHAILKSTSPLIIYWCKKYHCYFQGKIYRHPGGETVSHAFVLWCHLLRTRCNCTCYNSMNFEQLCSSILDKEAVVSNDREVDGFFTLSDV